MTILSKQFFLLCLSIPLIGCAVNAADLQSYDHPTEIVSVPPGARIEIDSEYVGITPLTTMIPRRYQSEWQGLIGGGQRITYVAPVRITAYPVAPGQYTQFKIIGVSDPTPHRIFFDMRLGPIPQRQEIKQDIRVDTAR